MIKNKKKKYLWTLGGAHNSMAVMGQQHPAADLLELFPFTLGPENTSPELYPETCDNTEICHGFRQRSNNCSVI